MTDRVNQVIKDAKFGHCIDVEDRDSAIVFIDDKFTTGRTHASAINKLIDWDEEGALCFFREEALCQIRKMYREEDFNVTFGHLVEDTIIFVNGDMTSDCHNLPDLRRVVKKSGYKAYFVCPSHGVSEPL